MLKPMGKFLFSAALIVILHGFAAAEICPQGDLTGDCKVNWEDILIFAEQWLDSSECEELPCADFDGQNGINLSDFSVLAGHWQQTGIPLVINEFMASNNSDSGIHDPEGQFDDWIEIYNFGDMAIDIGGMYLTDNLGNPTKWQIPDGFPAQTTVAADGFILFWADEDTGNGPLHADFKLSAGGEDIGLFADANTMIDSITFGEQATNISYGRYPDASNQMRFFATPTPLADNNDAYSGEIEDVEFSYTRGFYNTSFNLTMACVTPGVSIYYTTNGKSPIVGEVSAPGSILYMAPVAISSTKCVRAAAIRAGWMPSRTTTHTYIFGASVAIKSMPAVSLVGDASNTLYEPNGIMAIVGGFYDSNGWHPSGTGSYNNPIHRGIAYERPVSFEIIDLPAATDYQSSCGIRVHGSDFTRPRYTRGDNWLCNNNKFSFNLFFRSDYGDNRFDFPFFPFTPEVERHQSVVLRAGMNDICSPFVKDEWMRRLFKEMGGVQETGTFANLYINGAYKYYYNPTGRADKEFYQEWYGTNNDFDVINQSGLRDGDWVAWYDLLNYTDSHNLSNTANYNYVATRFDIPLFVDYLILQIYSANFDWPNNNWVVHHERSDTGKFRYSVWDLEGIEAWWLQPDCSQCYKTAFEDCPGYDTGTPKGLNHGPWEICRLYRALKANTDFRQLFADHIHKHFYNGGVLTKDHLLAKWWEVFGEVSPVITTIPWDDNFIPNTFIPNRESYVLAAFEQNGLFNLNIGAPVFKVNGSYKHGGYISTSDTITITDPCSSGGTIYYTTDGNDPRMAATSPGSSPIQVMYVADSAAKKVRVPTSDIGTTWRGGSEPYNDSSWTSGIGGVGYEKDTGYESFIGTDVGTAMYNVNTSCYIRIPFIVDTSDIGRITVLTLRTRYDDGFVAYINGTEVKRVNCGGTPVWNSAASTVSPEATSAWNSYDISAYINLLHAGINILAIHGLNISKTSSDFLISSELEALVSPAVEPNLSPGAIAYTGGFTVDKSTHLKARIFKNTGEWSALNEAVYALPEVADNVRITEIMYHPQDTNDPNDPNEEYIELKNIGASTINLNLVHFTKGIDFTFGDVNLAAGAYILVVKNQDAFEAEYGTGRPIAGVYSGSLANDGERIKLKDAMGTTILDFSYGDGWRSITDGDGYSLTIINPNNPDPNSWDEKDSWRASAYTGGSPGWDDSGIVPNPGDIVINEVMSHSHAGAPDWIELYNTTAGPINIGGWYLSDNDSNLMKYRIANGTTINSGGYLVFYEDVNFGEISTDPGKLIPFALSENGEMVCLTSALDANGILTGYREKEDFEASETAVSFGRYYKAGTNNYNFVSMDYNTPGQANAYPKVGPIVISEITYHPDWPAGGNHTNDQYEYIELHNISSGNVTLYDYVEGEPWKFTDGIDYTFPDEVTIPAGGRIVIVKDIEAFSWRYQTVPTNIIYGPYSGWLSNSGEKVELSKPGDEYLGTRYYIRVDRVSYSDGSHPQDCPGNVDLWPIEADGGGDSLTSIDPNHYGNDPNNWAAETPSPGNP